MKERHILIPHKPKEKKQAICSEALSKIKENRKINENKPIRERLSLEDRANKLYDGSGDFGEFTADELAELWAGCMLSKENPYGKAYDDEIYDAIMDMGDVDSNISREIFDKADKIYDEKYHPLFDDTGDDIHEDVNDEKVIFVKQAEDYYDDADDYFDYEYLFSSDGNGIVITGNRHFKDYGDKALIDAINDTYDEKEALDALKEITGVEYEKYEKDEMHGYSQGDWQNIYYPVGTDQKILDEVENMYMGKYDVFISENDELVRVPHDISWNGTDAIKEYISDEFGYSPDSIVLKKKVSRKVYDDEDFDESLKEVKPEDKFEGTPKEYVHADRDLFLKKLQQRGHRKPIVKSEEIPLTDVKESEDDKRWCIDYVVGNTYKAKYIYAPTAKDAIKKANIKNIVDVNQCDENGKLIKESNGNDEIREYPRDNSHVYIKTKLHPDRWYKAMFYMNGKTPTFARYGTVRNDVIDWRYVDGNTASVIPDKDMDESCDLKERGLTRAEKHNRAMDRIWANKAKFDDAEARFLLANGYSKEDVEELRKHDRLNAEIHSKFGGAEGVKKAHDEFVESCGKKITEAPIYDLSPRYDSKQSFYGKARVDTGDAGDKNKLYSYNTLVAEIKDGKPVVYGTYSATTLRHIKDWLKQNGFKAETAKQIMADYGVVDESCKRESIGEDVSEYQKWVDYDMKKYHKISKDTMDKIKSAGLSVVKDQYGDYEVIADRPIGEKCESRKRITEGEELDRNGFVSLIRLGDHPYDGYSVLNDGYFVRRIYAESDDEAIDKFNQFLARKNESCGKKK